MNQVEKDLALLVDDLHVAAIRLEQHIEANALAVAEGFRNAIRTVRGSAAVHLAAFDEMISQEAEKLAEEERQKAKDLGVTPEVETAPGGFVPPVGAPSEVSQGVPGPASSPSIQE